ncbi:MAG: hypothetical protein ACXIVO_04935 [Glycocaulis sp.]
MTDIVNTPTDLIRGQEANIPLDWVVADPSISARSKGLHPQHLQDLVEARKNEKPWPPLTVALVDGEVILIDGYHRHAAALEAEGANEDEVILNALVHVTVHPEADTLEAARYAAWQLNRKTKLPLSRAEKQEEGIRRYFAANLHRRGEMGNGNPKAIRKIARELELPYSTCRRLLKTLDAGRYWKMVQDDAPEAKNTDAPGRHWRAKRKAAITEASRIIAALGRKEPEHARAALEQAWSRLPPAPRGAAGETLGEYATRREADPYGFLN